MCSSETQYLFCHGRNGLGVDDGVPPSLASSTAYAANAVNQYGTVGSSMLTSVD
jgi:hypothetical protein